MINLVHWFGKTVTRQKTGKTKSKKDETEETKITKKRVSNRRLNPFSNLTQIYEKKI
jgi:hypothetical protein